MAQIWHALNRPNIGQKTTQASINGYLVENNCTVEVPLHPLYSSRGRWVIGSSLSKYVCEVEPYGQFEIPSGSVLSAMIYQDANNDYVFSVKFKTIFDVSTGDCRLECYITSDDSSQEIPFYLTSKNCAVDVPVHQSVQDALGFRRAERDLHFGMANTVLGFAGNIASAVTGDAFGAITGGISNAISGASNAMNSIDDASKANAVSVSGNGSSGSYLSFASDLCTPKVHCYFNWLSDEYNIEKGRPLCKPKVLNTLSGYAICDKADIATTGTATENNMIINFLNSGYYYE